MVFSCAGADGCDEQVTDYVYVNIEGKPICLSTERWCKKHYDNFVAHAYDKGLPVKICSICLKNLEFIHNNPIVNGKSCCQRCVDNTDGEKSFLIGIEGTIGVGKTFFCAKNKNRFKVIEENVPGSILSAFYSDTKKYGLAFQFRMFYNRLVEWKVQMELVKHGVPMMKKTDSNSSSSRINVCLLDRTVMGDLVFATTLYIQGTLDENEYNMYLNSWNEWVPPIYKNHCRFIYLDAPPKVTKARIKQRGIMSEQSIDMKYLETLYLVYFNMVCCLMELDVPVFVYDWSDLQKIPDPTVLINSIIDGDGPPPPYKNRSIETEIFTTNQKWFSSTNEKDKRMSSSLRYLQFDVDDVHEILKSIASRGSYTAEKPPTPKIYMSPQVKCWYRQEKKSDIFV